MNNLSFFTYLLTLVVGFFTLVLSLFLLGVFTYLKMFGLWFFIMIGVTILCSYLTWDASNQVFSFIKRHGIS